MWEPLCHELLHLLHITACMQVSVASDGQKSIRARNALGLGLAWYDFQRSLYLEADCREQIVVRLHEQLLSTLVRSLVLQFTFNFLVDARMMSPNCLYSVNRSVRVTSTTSLKRRKGERTFCPSRLEEETGRRVVLEVIPPRRACSNNVEHGQKLRTCGRPARP